jgi:hypothetical protein
MTVNELRKELNRLVRENKAHGDLPVVLFSDAEGNSEHELERMGLGVTHEGAKPDSVVLVPSHDPRPVDDSWADGLSLEELRRLAIDEYEGK